jgi:hypothetical protein
VGSGGRAEVVFLGQAFHQESEVVAVELPLEGPGGFLVAMLEGEEAVFDLGQVGEVVGGEDFALDDGEVDLDLVEPAGMDGSVDEVGVGPPLCQSVDGGSRGGCCRCRPPRTRVGPRCRARRS